MAILGISCFFHDSAAAVISENGEIIAAVHEERFTRQKHDSRLPICSITYCIQEAKKKGEEIEAYIYYEKPIWIFMRLLETYFSTAPRGFSSFLPAMKTWITNKLFTKQNLIETLKKIDVNFNEEKMFFSEHHLSHAASAFYPSPFKDSAILCLDAVGEYVTSSAWLGSNDKIQKVWEINFPHSVGMLYSAFTYYCGFKVNSGEYKLMGLAPYGVPKYQDLILEKLIDLKDDGSFQLNMRYFKFHRGLKMISSDFRKLFKHRERYSEEPITEFYMDVASSIQAVTENIVIKMAKHLKKVTNSKNLCLAGGVALNCVANGKILDNCEFENIWVQPSAGDAGNALGSALAFRYLHQQKDRLIMQEDSMKSSYLGPEFSNSQVENFLKSKNIPYSFYEKNQLIKACANNLIEGKVVGWFQGKMEYGPRALGNRSILGDPRIKNMQKKMNLKIKNRESFRPFAPAILEEYKEEYFGMKIESPYMLLTRNLQENFLIKQNTKEKKVRGIERVNDIRSSVPAITHIDNSCRVQSVSKSRNDLFYLLIKEFYNLSKCPILINTSFNVRGEPVVCTPEDAFNCFIHTGMDVIVLGNFKVDKDSLQKGFEKNFDKPFTIED